MIGGPDFSVWNLASLCETDWFWLAPFVVDEASSLTPAGAPAWIEGAAPSRLAPRTSSIRVVPVWLPLAVSAALIKLLLAATLLQVLIDALLDGADSTLVGFKGFFIPFVSFLGLFN